MSSTSSSASTKKKKELPAADNHDKNARASKKIRCGKEEADRLGGGCWETLPAPAVRRICLMVGDASALSFCASCKAYQAAQPPLRILSITGSRLLDDQEYLSQESLQNEFCMKIVEAKDGAHRVVEALSSRHAREITHLFMAAIHGHDDQTDGPKSLLAGNLESYGKNLTSLQTLIIVHPRRGHTGDDEQIPRPRLNECALQLIRATTDTLKALKISAPVRFESDDARMVVEEAGGSLHYLDLNVVPWFTLPYPVRTRGEDNDTILLGRLASQRCTSLLAPAQIICHSHRPPWQPLSSGQPLAWPNDERQAFFETHRQCLTRCTEECESSSPPQPLWRCPEGYSGAWCGNVGYCTGAPYKPLDPVCFASPLVKLKAKRRALL